LITKATELNIEVDEQDNVIGVRPNKDFITGKHIHRSSHLLLYNSKCELLLQKRVPTKYWSPNKWSFSVSGTVMDESYEECIHRETQEEIGITVSATFLCKFPVFFANDKSFHAVYIGKSDAPLTPDWTEMSEVRWITESAVIAEVKNNPDAFAPGFVECMRKTNNLKNK